MVSGQKFKLPRSHGAYPRKMIRRKPLLSGETKCFLGPGQQRWDYGSQWFLDQNTLYTIGYENPTDWTPENFELVNPQVVFVGFFLDFAFLGDIWYHVTYPDLSYFFLHSSARDEYFRIIKLMDDVKSRIESIRFGKTYVTNCVWDSVSSFINVEQFGIPGVLVDDAVENYKSLSKTLGIVVPNGLYPGHIKTSLLNISIGSAIDLLGKHFPIPERAGNIFGGFSFPNAPIEFQIESMVSHVDVFGNAPYRDSVQRMKEEYDKFPSYAAKIYGLNVWGDAPYYPVLENAPAWFGGAKPSTVKLFEIVNLEFCKRIASDLADYGYSYEGDTNSMTVDSLVQTIADHFGFDPDNGKDLLA